MIKSLGLIAASQLFGLVLGLVRVKVISLGLGPSGMALYGIIQNVSGVASNLFVFGTSGSLLKNMRRYKKSNLIENIIISIQMYIGLSCLIVFCAVQSILLKYEFFFDVSVFTLWIYLSIIGLLSGLNSYRLAIVSLLESNSRLAFNIFANSILMGGLISVVLYFYNFNIVIVFAYILAQFIYLFVDPAYSIRWVSRLKIWPKYSDVKRLFRSNTFKVSWYLFIVGFGPGIIMLNLRYKYLNLMGQDDFGRVSAIWSLYFIVEGLYTQYLGATFLKDLGIKNESIKKKFSQFFYLLLSVTLVGVFIAYFLNDLVVRILFSTEFISQDLKIINFLSLLFIKIYIHLVGLILLKNFSVRKLFALELLYFSTAILLINTIASSISFLELLLFLQLIYATFVTFLIYLQRKLIFMPQILISFSLGFFGVLVL